ncbi:MAG: response regulator transcription factor [Flavobacteriales bacterium]|nr:response regulator transcription factor [Flavobacteriales bacterium]
MKQHKPGILLVEDEENFGMVLKNYLELNDFEVRWCRNGKEGLTGFINGSYDLCILDVMMPEKDGFSLAEDIRKTGSDIPIIFLSARSMKEDMIKGYRAGGDDYLVKPFDTEVLLHKLHAMIARKSGRNGRTQECYSIHTATFSPSLRILKIGAKENTLSPREAQLLTLLCENMNSVLSRDEALTKIWKDDSYFSSRSMDVFITRLRNYFREMPEVTIVNVHGDGFRLMVQHNIP